MASVFVFTPHDISSVQGTTEAYYVSRHFAKIFDTHIFGPLSSGIEGATVHSHPYSGLFGLLMINCIYLPYWIGLGMKERPEIIYTYRNVILPPIVLKMLFGARVVCDLRVHPVEQPREFNDSSIKNRILVLSSFIGHRIVIKHSDVIITLSKPLKLKLAESFPIDEKDILIVPLGVDPEVFMPQSTEENKFTIAYMGSIKPIRGIEQVIRALNELPEKYQREVTFELFGSYEEHYAEEIEALANGGEYAVTWHGLIPHDEVPAQVGKADCAISPLPPYDGFEVSSPAKIYEYLALGLPIIATNITPHERILSHGQDSLLVSADDPDKMAAAIERLIKDESFRSSLSENARTKGIKNSWEKRINTILMTIDDQTDFNVDERF